MDLDHISQIVLSENGTRAFALEYGAAARMAQVQIAGAVQTLIADNGAARAQAREQAAGYWSTARPVALRPAEPRVVWR
ncbi:hypothetical protein [Rhodanobacter lindaniclasticus]|uniref:hypothetical protein n=1 Tax=Rhodanobacter lindaniclasticus TaxID=75310 RepID=UPI00109FF154|nr:hypothetical protein [Rhodanobacter lindaniclasticus]